MRKGDTISPKLFTKCLENNFLKIKGEGKSVNGKWKLFQPIIIC